MSETEDCLRRLSKMYQDGTHTISWSQLFHDTKLTQNQMKSVIDTLVAMQAIKITNQMGQLLPYQIDILPGSVDATSKIRSQYSFENWQRKYKDHPVIGTIIFLVFVAVLILGVLKAFGLYPSI